MPDELVVYTLRLLRSERKAWEKAAKAELRPLNLWLRWHCERAVGWPPPTSVESQPSESDPMVTVSPRATAAELASWKTAAARAELTFSAWIRNVANAAVLAAGRSKR
jgi:hypothetical protein